MKLAALGLALAVLGFAQEISPRHEVGLTLGRFLSTTRGGASGGFNRLKLGSGTALQANYGYRLAGGGRAALYGEVHFLASPQRLVTSSDSTLTRDVATLFLTPGLRVKFAPARAIAPYVAVGAGWANYEQSTATLSGRPNPAPRTLSHGAINYGTGVDVRFWRFIGFRAEIRDFYAGAPAYGASAALRGGQHNVVAGGGFVLRFP